MTPINEAICYFSSIDLDNYNVDAIVRYLESLLPKEKEFVEKVWDASTAWQAEQWRKEGGSSPDKQQLIKSLYKE